MRRFVRALLAVCATGVFSADAFAQSITFSPATPRAGDTVRVQFSEPFDCAAPVPKLVTRVGNGFVFESVFSSGIVNCPFVPFPPPKTSNFSVPLGVLPAGSYDVRWKMYVSDATGARKLVSNSSAGLAITASDPAAPKRVPASSPVGLLLLAIALAFALHLRKAGTLAAKKTGN